MYNRVRRKMSSQDIILISIVLILQHAHAAYTPLDNINLNKKHKDDYEDNNIIDFGSDYDKKVSKNYDVWNGKEFAREAHKYTIIKNKDSTLTINNSTTSEMPLPMEITTEILTQKNNTNDNIQNITVEFSTTLPMMKTTEADVSVIPLELLSTTEDSVASILDRTGEPELTVIPLSTTRRAIPNIEIDETVTLPTSTEPNDETTTDLVLGEVTEPTATDDNEPKETNFAQSVHTNINNSTSDHHIVKKNDKKTDDLINTTSNTKPNNATLTDDIHANSSKVKVRIDRNDKTLLNDDIEKMSEETDVPVFTGLDIEASDDVPEDYYDSKDAIPTKVPNTDALSVIFGFAGSVVESMVESVAERVVPKGLYDLFKRMQRQSEALEAERLRSREENGGLGQFGRGILKTISSGLSKPLSQLMGARDNGSLDSDRSFVSSLASGVSSVATSVVDTFKDRVQAIYPGTVWCGDGHSGTARSGELGLFFFTDTCCRQHDACKLFIRAGETKHGLTNTGLFTRSHCSCDVRFRDCLRQTNSLISAQIGLTYFNVLGPQCFRRAHPILRCVRRTRITGQKCEEYELDYTKPKMWQWFDNETF